MPDKQPETQPVASELDALRSDLNDMKLLVRAVLEARVSVPAEVPPPPPLESLESDRERFTKAWAREPQVRIIIAPDDNDRLAVADIARRTGSRPAYPPRHFQVNGIGIDLPVGEETTVPQSIAALYAHTQNPYRERGILPPITFDQAAGRVGLN